MTALEKLAGLFAAAGWAGRVENEADGIRFRGFVAQGGKYAVRAGWRHEYSWQEPRTDDDVARDAEHDILRGSACWFEDRPEGSSMPVNPAYGASSLEEVIVRLAALGV